MIACIHHQNDLKAERYGRRGIVVVCLEGVPCGDWRGGLLDANRCSNPVASASVGGWCESP